ncbi:hypothetical protein EDD18DRAFT_1334069 [Armillaria luteobubalina]|uniref:Uncharacterized protein n=1 Tax=Armillaria luteobubalina TaxID=153913 RepID=A0AA39UK23_9AGAR|nr:hypothetical protein EDD18DRAFT_1334069 [Armillaria luteobubalina]
MLQVSMKMLQVVKSNAGNMSHIELQSTWAMTVPARVSTNITQSYIMCETQITGTSYQTPGSTNPVKYFEELNSGTSFSYCLKLCKERLLQLNIFNSPMPLQHAPYMVAWHQGHCVKMIGFSEVKPAWAVYNAFSTNWPYIVTFHHQDCVRMISLSMEVSGQVVYGVISTKFAKILMVLVSHGYGIYTNECKKEVCLLDAFQSAIPLQTTSYIVTFHQNTCIRMLGFLEDGAAHGVYGAVSIHWAKVLVDRQNSKNGYNSFSLNTWGLNLHPLHPPPGDCDYKCNLQLGNEIISQFLKAWE